MAINLHLPPKSEALKPTITVFGVGGAGGNAVNNMISSQLEGVNFVVANTDAQALERSNSERRIQLGANVTRGLAAGAFPEVGREAAEEVLDEIAEHMEGSNMVFITAGMGGGTGTGAAPVIARMAREQNVLTVGVVTKPFHFEGTHRMKSAEYGLEELQKYVDTLIVIPNQNLFRVANEHTTFADAFKMADEVLHSGVRGVTDLMVMPGLINLDFADIRAVMQEMGKAMMGTGEAAGDKRAIEAAEAAISNPLLDDVSRKGARGVLINITGGLDMTLFEVDEAANRIRDEVDPEANIIFGSTFNDQLEGQMRVSVVATGIEAQERSERPPFTGSTTQARATRSAASDSESRFRFPAPKSRSEAPREPEVKTESRREPEEERPAPSPARPQATSGVPRFSRSRMSNAAVAEQPEEEDSAARAQYMHEEEIQQPVMEEQPYAQAEPVAEEPQAEPGFVPPRAEQPAQRSHYVSRPMEEDRVAGRGRSVRTEERAPESKSMNFFQRRAGGNKAEPRDAESRQAERRVAVKENPTPSSVAGDSKKEDDNDYLDIPAFLRRQAN